MLSQSSLPAVIMRGSLATVMHPKTGAAVYALNAALRMRRLILKGPKRATAYTLAIRTPAILAKRHKK